MDNLSITHTLMRKVRWFVSDRCCHSDHSLRVFADSPDYRVNPIGQSGYQTASSSRRIPAGTRSTSRKIGKLKAALPSKGIPQLLVA